MTHDEQNWLRNEGFKEGAYRAPDASGARFHICELPSPIDLVIDRKRSQVARVLDARKPRMMPMPMMMMQTEKKILRHLSWDSPDWRG